MVGFRSVVIWQPWPFRRKAKLAPTAAVAAATAAAEPRGDVVASGKDGLKSEREREEEGEEEEEEVHM
jgi:ribosomal protein L12E/L44/L45/RPP1/RPP2